MEEDKELQFKLKQEWSDLKVWAEEEIKKALPEAKVPKTTWEWLSLTCLQVDILFEKPGWDNSRSEEGRWSKSTLGVRLRCRALNKAYNHRFDFTTKDTTHLQKVIAKIQALNNEVLQREAAAETRREKEKENYRLQKEDFADMDVPYNLNLKRREFSGHYDFRYTHSDLPLEKAKAIIAAIQNIMFEHNE